MNKKKISKDFLYNIMAMAVSTGVMQLIVYPYLASQFSQSIYGTLLTVMGIVNTIANSFGNSLNNVRLINNTDYNSKGYVGDFNLLLNVSSILSTIIICILGSVWFKFDILTIILLGILVILITVRCYHVVSYRLVLDFRKILLQNILLSIGYIIGLGIAYFTKQWVFIFICAEFISLIYIFKTSKLYKESVGTTPLFAYTLKKYGILIVTGLSINLLTYLDRLMLYPLLGAESVAIYTVASFFGKSLGIITTPINGVLLGYYSQSNFKMDRKLFWKINAVVICGGTVFMGITTIISPAITKFLYPSVFNNAQRYIFMANLAAVVGVIANSIQPAVLKFAPTYFQLIKELLYCVVYLGLGVLLLKLYGVMGFCYGALIANLAKMSILCLMGTFGFDKGKKRKGEIAE